MKKKILILMLSVLGLMVAVVGCTATGAEIKNDKETVSEANDVTIDEEEDTNEISADVEINENTSEETQSVTEDEQHKQEVTTETSETNSETSETSETTTTSESESTKPESTKPETTTSEPTTEAKQPEKVWVVDKEAWTESVWVVDKPASTTEVWVVDQAAWTETTEIWMAKCGCCGELMNYFDPNWDDIWYRHCGVNQYYDPSDPCHTAGWCEVTIPGETIYHEEVGHYETQTVPEQGHWETIEHPEEGHWETR